ncbi:MAG: glycosyltransferase family 4 protein, partial [Brevundimonas sp.]
MANAVNIIDGFNGLAAATSMLMFAAFGYVAWALRDPFIVQVCLAMIGALAGFFVWNYPRGRIFLGDGGAYLVGFVLAEVAVLLVVRHPQVSPWFCFLVCAYPVTETLFSIYRRRLRACHP